MRTEASPYIVYTMQTRNADVLIVLSHPSIQDVQSQNINEKPFLTDSEEGETG